MGRPSKSQNSDRDYNPNSSALKVLSTSRVTRSRRKKANENNQNLINNVLENANSNGEMSEIPQILQDIFFKDLSEEEKSAIKRKEEMEKRLEMLEKNRGLNNKTPDLVFDQETTEMNDNDVTPDNHSQRFLTTPSGRISKQKSVGGSAQTTTTTTPTTKTPKKLNKPKKTNQRLTPLGLPKKPKNFKNRFTIEDIYLNKDYKTPLPKALETIYENDHPNFERILKKNRSYVVLDSTGSVNRNLTPKYETQFYFRDGEIIKKSYRVIKSRWKTQTQTQNKNTTIENPEIQSPEVPTIPITQPLPTRRLTRQNSASSTSSTSSHESTNELPTSPLKPIFKITSKPANTQNLKKLDFNSNNNNRRLIHSSPRSSAKNENHKIKSQNNNNNSKNNNLLANSDENIPIGSTLSVVPMGKKLHRAIYFETDPALRKKRIRVNKKKKK